MSDDPESFPGGDRTYTQWMVENPAAAAAARAAARWGIVLREREAAVVAQAVLERADGERRVQMEVAPEHWSPAVRDKVLARLRHQLAIDLMDNKQLPTALPREVITTSPKWWEPVKVELVVPVRRPA